MTRRQNDDDRMHWESAAEDAVEAALDEAEFDEIRRVVVLPGPEGPFRDVYEFSDIEELRRHLEEIYDTEWYANVPFDSGEAVFDSDADGFVSDHVADRGIESFFYDIRDPEDTVPIIGSNELVADANRSRILRIDMQEINAELIRYLARNPQFMRELNPRKFEELVAELFRDKGYEVELTPRSRDGGLDIIAVERSDLGSALTLIECKRYAPSNRVGVEIVRGLYGVVEEKRATRGILATTSFFTKDASTFRNSVQYRLGFADFDVLSGFLNDWRQRKSQERTGCDWL